MALTANREVDHYEDQELHSFPVGAGVHICKGALVGHCVGYALPLIAGNQFLGIAYEEADNRGGDTGCHCVSVRVYTQGDFGFCVPGVVASHLGLKVFASADDEVTFESGGEYVGRCIGVLEQQQIILRLRTFA